MATLIISKNGDGAIKGRCDANCYNAIRPKCTCVCAGMNHGKGMNTASRNTFLHKEIFETAQTAAYILFPPVQYKLFQEETI